MVTSILLIRHGRTPTTGKVLPGRAAGLHLSEEGRAQAKRVAHGLGKVDAIYTSPLERARETATPSAEKQGLSATVCDALLECDFGQWTGAKLSELSKLPEWKTVQNAPQEFRFPGGESFVEMQQRIVDGLCEIAAAHEGQTVACFSHADPIKAALIHFQGEGWERFQKIDVQPAQVNRIELGGA